MGALYSNLAIVAEYSGDMRLARQMSERALDLRTEANDRWGIGVSLGNLASIAVKEGALDEARARSEAAIEVLGEVGDRWMTANAQNNLGNAARDLGDYPAAREAYAESLGTFAEWDDHWALAILLEDIALLAVRIGDHAGAVELAAAATALREEIGAQHPKALAAELRTQIAPSVRAPRAQRSQGGTGQGRGPRHRGRRCPRDPHLRDGGGCPDRLTHRGTTTVPVPVLIGNGGPAHQRPALGICKIHPGRLLSASGLCLHTQCPIAQEPWRPNVR